MLAISERCLYSISCTSIVIMMNQIEPKQSREQSKAKQRAKQSRDSHTHIHLIIDSDKIKSNQIKDMLLDSDDNLLYDSDLIPFDLIRFDFI